MSARTESPFDRAIRAREVRERAEEAERARRARAARDHGDGKTARRVKQMPRSNGKNRNHKIECQRCGFIGRTTIGSVIRAGGLPTCACGGDFIGDAVIEQLFETSQRNGRHERKESQ